jgi:hypothetical protein
VNGRSDGEMGTVCCGPEGVGKCKASLAIQLSSAGWKPDRQPQVMVLDCLWETVNSMTIRFVATAAKVIFAWPFYATCHAVALANTYQGFRSKAVTFMTFLPALIVTTLIWAGSWALAFWLLMGIG